MFSIVIGIKFPKQLFSLRKNIKMCIPAKTSAEMLHYESVFLI